MHVTAANASDPLQLSFDWAVLTAHLLMALSRKFIRIVLVPRHQLNQQHKRLIVTNSHCLLPVKKSASHRSHQIPCLAQISSTNQPKARSQVSPTTPSKALLSHDQLDGSAAPARMASTIWELSVNSTMSRSTHQPLCSSAISRFTSAAARTLWLMQERLASLFGTWQR